MRVRRARCWVRARRPAAVGPAATHSRGFDGESPKADRAVPAGTPLSARGAQVRYSRPALEDPPSDQRLRAPSRQLLHVGRPPSVSVRSTLAGGDGRIAERVSDCPRWGPITGRDSTSTARRRPCASTRSSVTARTGVSLSRQHHIYRETLSDLRISEVLLSLRRAVTAISGDAARVGTRPSDRCLIPVSTRCDSGYRCSVVFKCAVFCLPDPRLRARSRRSSPLGVSAKSQGTGYPPRLN